MSESVKVSVVTACYNSAKTIGTTIQSVNAQSYANIEQVFIDGGSTDDTLDVISASARKDRSTMRSIRAFSAQRAMSLGFFMPTIFTKTMAS